MRGVLFEMVDGVPFSVDTGVVISAGNGGRDVYTGHGESRRAVPVSFLKFQMSSSDKIKRTESIKRAGIQCGPCLLIAFDNVPGRDFHMSVASITNGSMAMSIATYATLLKDAETKSDAQVAVLSEALELQEEMTADLLQVLDVGQIIDVVV